MITLIQIASALGEPNRVRILLALRHGPLCVCQITELLGLATSTVSKHLALLKQVGLVTSRKEGRWIHYSLPKEQADPMVGGALEWVLSSLARKPQVTEDDAALARIRELDKEELCRRQRAA